MCDEVGFLRLGFDAFLDGYGVDIRGRLAGRERGSSDRSRLVLVLVLVLVLIDADVDGDRVGLLG